VLPKSDSDEWFWAFHDDPDFATVGSCAGDTEPLDGDWIAATVQGRGADTVVSVWRWDTDPDAGGPVDIATNWGPPDCQITSDPATPVDTGHTVAIRSYTGRSTSASRVDGWAGGDAPDPIPPLPPGPVITLILDSSGTGTPDSMIDPDGIAVDSQGNVWVAACGTSGLSTDDFTSGLFKITATGEVTKVIDASGDGVHPFDCGVGVAVDPFDNVFVAAFISDNVFKVTPDGAIIQVLDSSGAGLPGSLVGPIHTDVDAAGNLFVSGAFSDNVFKVEPGGAVTEIIGPSGDGAGNVLTTPFGVAADPSGNLFVAGVESDNVFKVTPAGQISVVLDAMGDGIAGFDAAHGIAADANGDVYVTGNRSDNVFRIEPSGTVTEIVGPSGDGTGNVLDNPTGIAVNAGRVYITGFDSDNVFEWDDGFVTQILDGAGDGVQGFDNPADDSVAVDPATGAIYVTGTRSDTVFRIILE